MKLFSILLLLGTSAFATESKNAYQLKIETSIPGKSPTTEVIDFGEYEKNPGKKISRFYETKDGTYLNEFFPPREMASKNDKKLISLPVISGKLPDPKVGADLNNMEYGFNKVNDVITIYQNDPSDPNAPLFKMKIQLLRKDTI